MRGCSVLWGVPDFGRVAIRERLIDVLAAGGDRLRLIVAPSGWGKTMLAAQYAERHEGDVLWIDAGGQQLSDIEFAAEILRGLRRDGCSDVASTADPSRGTSLPDLVDACRSAATVRLSGGAQPLLVVVDDVADGPDCTIEELASVHRGLFGCGVRLLVTGRSAESCSLETGQRSVTVGTAELRLHEEEARAVLVSSGFRDAVDIPRLLEECGGHVVLFLLLARESESAADNCSSQGPATSASAWVGRVLQSAFDSDEVEWLLSAAVLKRGTGCQLARLGVKAPDALIERASVRLPLFRASLADSSSSKTSFFVHDIAESWLLSRFDPAGCAEHSVLLERAIEELALSDRLGRAAMLVATHGSQSQRITFLTTSGRSMLDAYMLPQLRSLLESVSLHSLMEQPALLLLWAEVLLEMDEPKEAVHKARAASQLAQHGGDKSTVVSSRLVEIECLKREDRHTECIEIANDIDSLLRTTELPNQVRLNALICTASVCVANGDLDKAIATLSEALAQPSPDAALSRNVGRLNLYLNLTGAMQHGAYVEAAAAVGRVVPSLDTWLTDRVVARGNLAACLIETGRIERTRALVRYAMKHGSDYYRSAFGVFEGIIAATAGYYDDAQVLFAQTDEISRSIGCETDIAANRVAYAVALRAAGELEAALSASEQAFESLSGVDFMGFRRLAAVEVAASLLSLDDVPAARRWLSILDAEGFGKNVYHALRAAMVAAECDRRDGNLDSGIARLSAHRDHIISESSNLQMAMYCRAFPHLLGMLAAAVGASELPTHMLRLLLPENAEASLAACRPWLDTEEWSVLGRRTLGTTELARLERRRGEPVCRVRLFGGLEVALAERTLTEGDWKKRKARLLFAMLVVKRGQDVPREQFLEYLWPEFPEERARNNFYVAWSAMKKALMGEVSRSESCPYAENKGGRCRIIRDAVHSDIDEFAEALLEAREADTTGDHVRAIAAYSRLSAVYRGDLLPGDLYDDWFADARDRYRFDFVDAMVRAADMLLEHDDPCEALVFARRALQVEGLREDLYQVTLKCHIAAGQRSGAIDTFIQCRSRLSEDLGLDPSSETMDLYQEILVMEDRPRYDDYGLSTTNSSV